MRNVLSSLTPLAVVLAVLYFLVSNAISWKGSEKETRDTETQVKEQKAKTAKQLQRESLILDLVTKHNAVADWREVFGQLVRYISTYSGSPIYTIQVEDVLVRADARPVMFVAYIEDVVRSGDGYSLHFSEYSYFFGLLHFPNPNFRFVLHCTQDQVNHIMQDHKGNSVPFPRAHYAVIAHISDVRKVSLQLTARADPNTFYDSGNFDVDIRENLKPANIFVATGQCVDLLFVGDQGPKKPQDGGSK